MAREKKSLGESLVAEGVITNEQLKKAQEEEARSGRRLTETIVKLGYVTEENLIIFLSNKLGIPRIDLKNHAIDPQVIELVPEIIARKYELIPVLKAGNRLTCAMADPWNIFALDEIRARTSLTVEPAVATAGEIKKALDEYYDTGVKAKEPAKPAIEPKPVAAEEKKEMAATIITEAVNERATSIHIEPEENDLKIRFRIDGILREVPPLSKTEQSALISKIKSMAGLNALESSLPQDGRFKINADGKQVSVRVSCMPTVYGENIVLRIFDTSNAIPELNELGFSKEILEKWEKLITRTHGMILVTGPAGSGRTTTLYASLNKINTVDKSIVTIEDPVEYRLPRIRQVQINTKADFTFTSTLRSILKQDPNIIMVDEIRNSETAEMTLQAALTGRLIFAVLSTGDAPEALARAIEMGIGPSLVSSAVIGVLAQRLVRKICPDCKEKYSPDKDILKEIGINGTTKFAMYKGKGCSRCMDTGYKGRVAIYELLVPDSKIRAAVSAKSSADEIRKLALSSGMASLKEDGISKIKEGLTTPEELLRVTEE